MRTNLLQLCGLELLLVLIVWPTQCVSAQDSHSLWAGTGSIEITHPQAQRVADACYAKALVFKQANLTTVLITLDAVAVGGIGAIGDDFLETVRRELAQQPGIDPAHIMISASHCHGNVRGDCHADVVQMVRLAYQNMVPVAVGTGTASENRISENRRVKLKDGSQVDMRRAYALAWDDQIESVGPIDPEVGILKIQRTSGELLAVLYNFACHPIMNSPSKGSSADFVGVASAQIEKSLGSGVTAFFVQGCGGDINPVQYKSLNQPADATPLGCMLATSVLQALPEIATTDSAKLSFRRQLLSIPRAADYQVRIESLVQLRASLVDALRGTNLNFKDFVPLLIRRQLAPQFPSASAQAYLHQQQLGNDAFQRTDADNAAQLETYFENIRIMEQITRLNTNLALLKMHQQKTAQAALPTIDCELCGWRIGDFRMVTFPGELTVQIGLNLKKVAPANCYVAGYTNGYIHYLPTVEQRNNSGYAQEDCDCLVAPEWQRIFEDSAARMLSGLD